MDVYMDLSMLLLILLGITIISSIKLITFSNFNNVLLYIFIIIQPLFIFLVYLSTFISFLIFHIFNLFYIYLMSKDNKLINVTLYFVFYYLFSLVLTGFNQGIISKNSILIITSKEGILLSLLVPLFGIMMIISSKVVDKTFHLHNYKTKVYLTINNKEKLYSSYFDTGNTCKYRNVPVIFLKNTNIEIDKKIFNKTIEIQTIKGNETIYVCEGLLRKKDDNESYFVYVGLSNNSSFQGCEVLLNAYLF